MEVAVRLLISAVAFLPVGFAIQMTSDAHAKNSGMTCRYNQSGGRCYHVKYNAKYRPVYWRPRTLG
jgi:hypothetical protein